MKTFKDINKKETDLEEACWVGYRKDGMKKKGDRMVPNCVKEEVINAVYGKEWIYEEPTNENVGDMYKGKLSDTQITNLKNLWKTKKQSDVTPSVKSYVQGLDQFTKMDIKQANIKYLSNLIDSVQKEEVDFITPLKEQIEIVEMNSVVRKTDLKEFNSDQIERLAKAYSMMKDRTISVDNAKRLVRMMDNVPVGSLNALRKKKIPFLSGLAMTRMIKLKMPITETYTVQITKKDGSKMSLGRYNTSAEAQRYVDQYGAGAKIVKEDLNKEEVKESVDDIRKNPNWKLRPGGGMYPRYNHPKHGEINIDRYGGWMHYDKNNKKVAFYSPSYPDNKFSNAGATSKDLSDYMKLKKINEDLDKDDKKTIEPIIKQLQKSVTAHGKQAKQLKKDIKDEKDLEEADLSKSQITKVHKQADDLPKKDFMKRYGKDGDAVRYATATNMVKKKLGLGEDSLAQQIATKADQLGIDSTVDMKGIHVSGFKDKKNMEIFKQYLTKIGRIKALKMKEEDNKLITKGELKMNESYKLKLNSAMEHYKIDSLAELKDEDQKAFFSYVDSLTEGLTAGQKKLPAGLQKAILAKQGKKDEMHDTKKDDKKEIKEEDAYDKDDPKQKPKKEMMNAMKEMMKEMSSKIEMLKAETDPKKMEMMKKEMMTAMKKMPEMAEMSEMMKNEMMKEMMKKMDEYGSMNITSMKKEMKEPMSAMKMNAMKMPIRKTENLVGGQKKLDKDKDGDLDAKDFAMLRKTKSEAVKTGEADAEPKVKELNAMVKNPMNAMKDPMNAMKDMNATYMKSNVKAPVMNNGGD